MSRFVLSLPYFLAVAWRCVALRCAFLTEAPSGQKKSFTIVLVLVLIPFRFVCMIPLPSTLGWTQERFLRSLIVPLADRTVLHADPLTLLWWWEFVEH